MALCNSSRVYKRQKIMSNYSSTVPRLNFLPLANLPVAAVGQLIEVVLEFCHDLQVWLAEALIKLRTIAALLWMRHADSLHS